MNHKNSKVQREVPPGIGEKQVNDGLKKLKTSTINCTTTTTNNNNNNFFLQKKKKREIQTQKKRQSKSNEHVQYNIFDEYE